MSMLKALTWPSNSDVRLLTFGPAMKVYVRAGLGGCRTSRASRRRSVPNLRVWWPRTIEMVSRYSVTEVVNFEFAPAGAPICWNPVTVKNGNTEPKAVAGTPGTVKSPVCGPIPLDDRRGHPKRGRFRLKVVTLPSYSPIGWSARVKVWLSPPYEMLP